MDRINHPLPASPTSSLPPLAHISQRTSAEVKAALDNLRAIYFPPPPPPAPSRIIKVPKRNPKLRHLIHDISVPDSGYASAEEEDVEETQIVEEPVTVSLSPEAEAHDAADENENEDLDILRSDTFERTFAIKWLTGFAARADLWLDPDICPPTEEAARAALIDAAAALLSAFVGGEPEAAVTRTFSFPFGCSANGEKAPITVELNDAPLLSEDHTSVGLQCWASSILLAERMAADSGSFGLEPDSDTGAGKGGRRGERRILELGAGTGLLSIATAKILERHGDSEVAAATMTIVATDFHSDVLANLQKNIDANFDWDPVDVQPLDWEHPVYQAPLDEPFRVILAADVVYEPLHAAWIRSCVEQLLLKPQGEDGAGGVFWMIIADRPSGRHAGLADTVFDVFPKSGSGDGVGEWDLVILDVEHLE
ncbi:hypothetical protein EVG20_g10673, partial [Dentipellis fragilis]